MAIISPQSRGEFTRWLWGQAQGIYDSILEHPFLGGLTDASLPHERFRYYVLQDAIYLRDFARALSLVGLRSGDERTLRMFNDHSSGAVAVEQSLHEGFLADLGVSAKEASGVRPSPTTVAYTSFLLRSAAVEDYHRGLAAVLPCYWVYARVGEALAAEGSPEPMYERWISTYAAEEFTALVEEVLDTADRVGEDLNERQRAQAGQDFATAARYEWMFWDAGWRMEGWRPA